MYRKTKRVHNVCIGRRREYTSCVQEDEGSTQSVSGKTMGQTARYTDNKMLYTDKKMETNGEKSTNWQTNRESDNAARYCSVTEGVDCRCAWKMFQRKDGEIQRQTSHVNKSPSAQSVTRAVSDSFRHPPLR